MASGGGYKTLPILEDEKSYDQWRDEISVWQLVTELKPDKQALAVTLCLRRKERETALEIDAKDLNKYDGMTRLLTKLDSVNLRRKLLMKHMKPTMHMKNSHDLIRT